jgi:hypothetical protein
LVSQPTGAQVAPNGDVAVSSSVCVGAWYSYPPSDAADCISAPYTTSYYGQLLIGYLVPDGTTAPSSFSSTDLGGISFTPNSVYTDWLTTENKATTPAGDEWFGYISSEGTITQASEIDVTADFGPPAGSAGSPYSGPFVVPTVEIGERELGSSTSTVITDPNSPLDCSANWCGGDTSVNPISVDTRELTTTAPASAITVQAGNTATIPFTVAYAGPSADPFSLSASTSSNALVAAPVNQTFAPSGSGNTTEDVSVPVPAGLAPGSYTVTLNVGSFGSTAATLNVTAPTPTGTTTATTTTTTTPVGPQQSAALRPEITGLDVNPKSLQLTLRLNIAATERLTLQRLRHHRWITLKKLATHGSIGANRLHLRGLFGSLLKRQGRYRLVVSAFNGTVGSVSQSLTFTIR